VVLVVDGDGLVRGWLGGQVGGLFVGEVAQAGPFGGDAAEELVGAHVEDAGAAREFVHQQRVAGRGVGGLEVAGDLGAAGEDVHPERVRPAGERGGDGAGDVGGAADADRPRRAAQQEPVGGADHAEHSGLAEPFVPAGDRVLGDPEHRGDRGERGAAVEVQGVDEPTVDVIDGFHAITIIR
jgi:hypothetical protein